MVKESTIHYLKECYTSIKMFLKNINPGTGKCGRRLSEGTASSTIYHQGGDGDI